MVFLRAGNPCKTSQEVLNNLTPSGNFALSNHESKRIIFCFLQSAFSFLSPVLHFMC